MWEIRPDVIALDDLRTLAAAIALFCPSVFSSSLYCVFSFLVKAVPDPAALFFSVQKLVTDCTSESDLLGRRSGRHRKLHFRRVGACEEDIALVLGRKKVPKGTMSSFVLLIFLE